MLRKAGKKLIEVRRAVELAEVVPSAGSEGFKLNRLFTYDARKDELVKARPSHLAKAIASSLGESEAAFWERVKKRAAFLSSLAKSAGGTRFQESVEKISSFR